MRYQQSAEVLRKSVLRLLPVPPGGRVRFPSLSTTRFARISLYPPQVDLGLVTGCHDIVGAYRMASVAFVLFVLKKSEPKRTSLSRRLLNMLPFDLLGQGVGEVVTAASGAEVVPSFSSSLIVSSTTIGSVEA